MKYVAQISSSAGVYIDYLHSCMSSEILCFGSVTHSIRRMSIRRMPIIREIAQAFHFMPDNTDLTANLVQKRL